MYNEVINKIKEYDNIIIGRHIGVDPDALCSQLALRDAILLTYPNKKVIAVGTGSSKFTHFGKLDKMEKLDNALVIITDTPDRRRVDGVDISSRMQYHRGNVQKQSIQTITTSGGNDRGVVIENKFPDLD